MKKNMFLMVIIMVLSGFSFIIAKNSEAKVNPQLLVNDGSKDESKLKMNKVIVDVKVVGTLAITTFDITFYNDFDRNLEGAFVFPMNENQSVNRFAMDFNGKLREAVTVEKNKGQVVFEELERKKIDPALLEKTSGNSYRARIFPILNKSTKRIVIAYQELLENGIEGMVYRLPLDIDEKLDTFQLSCEVYGTYSAPVLKGNEINGVDFSKIENAYATLIKNYNYKADKQFEISIPSPLEERNVLTENINGKTYFTVNYQPTILKKEKQLPSSICIFWDASNSGLKRDTEKELDLLNSYFKKNLNCSVELVIFSNDIDEDLNFQIVNGNWNDLKTKLTNIDYDGGTQLGAIDLIKYNSEEFFIFTDGVQTFGKKEIITSNKPIWTINSNQTAEHSYLSKIANNSGGAYINLMKLNNEEALKFLTEQVYSLISIDYDINAIESLYPASRQPINGVITLSGILKTNETLIQLNFGFNITEKTESIRINAEDNKVQTGFLDKIWASMKLAELLKDEKTNEKEINDLGRQFNIVTPFSSLIILDNARDYYRYQIEPPEELREEYLAIKANDEKQKVTSLQREITDSVKYFEHLLSIFQEKIKWWEKDYETTQNAKINQKNNNNQNPSNQLDSSFGILKGKVISKTTHNSIVGATIRIEGTRIGAVSKANGNFNIPRIIPPGNYVVKISAVGYALNSTNVHITATEETDINIELENAPVNTQPIEVHANKLAPSNSGNVESNPLAPSSSSSQRAESAPLSPGAASAEADALAPAARISNSERIMVDGLDAGDQFYRGENSISNKSGSISISSYNFDKPYMEKLKDADSAGIFKEYIKQKAKYGNNPGFYLDVAAFFNEKGNKKSVLKTLSNIAEFAPDNHEFLRILGYRLRQFGFYDYAIMIFKDVLKMRPEEPQSYRDLALALELNKDYQQAADLLYHVALKRWDNRFTNIGLIALTEMNKIIAESNGQVDTSKYDSGLLKNMPLDIRVVLNWDTDNCDIDLWVTDPHNEKCMYSHRSTWIGGRNSDDITQGYGPEEFMLRRAIDGIFKIQANYYGTRSVKIFGPVTIYLELYTKYGTPQEKRDEITLRLEQQKETVDIGVIKYENK